MYSEKISRGSYCIPIFTESHIVIKYSPIINEINNCSNVIIDSPNAKMDIINERNNLTKQEKELLTIYRELGIVEQAKLVDFVLKLEHRII